MLDTQCGCKKKDCPIEHEGRCENYGTHLFTLREGTARIEVLLCEPCGDAAMENEK